MVKAAITENVSVSPEVISEEFKKLDGLLKDARIVSLFLRHHLPSNKSVVEVDLKLYKLLHEFNNAVTLWTQGNKEVE